MNEKKKDSILSIAASLLCIAIGLLVGLIILYCINAENAWNGFTRIIQGGFYLRPKGIGSEISQAAPLIMTGLLRLHLRQVCSISERQDSTPLAFLAHCSVPLSCTCHGISVC